MDVKPAPRATETAPRATETAPPGLDAVGRRIALFLDDAWHEGKVLSFAGGKHKIKYNDGNIEIVDLVSEKYAFMSSATGENEASCARHIGPEQLKRCYEPKDSVERTSGDHRTHAAGDRLESSSGASAKKKRRYIVMDEDDEDLPSTVPAGTKTGSKTNDDTAYISRENMLCFEDDDCHLNGYAADIRDYKKGMQLEQTTSLCRQPSQTRKAALQEATTKSTLGVTTIREDIALETKGVVDVAMVNDCQGHSRVSVSSRISSDSRLGFEKVNINEASHEQRLGVYPAGAHTHDTDERYWILTKKRVDAVGRTASDPLFDRRTMRLPSKWSQVETSPVQLQWWHIKSRYADCLLFFKIGRFYEMYHTDADVGVEYAGLVYMKGACAHCGFPEQAYGKYLDILVRQGYKVARVEQTETPERNKLRIARMRKRGRKPDKEEQAMRRELCSLTTPSTRCYTYLDLATMVQSSSDPICCGRDASSLTCRSGTAIGTNGGGTGVDTTAGVLTDPKYLVAVKREEHGKLNSPMCGMQLDRLKDDNDLHCRASVQQRHRYGVCVVDCARGSFVLAEFDDDALTSTRLRTMLNEFPPAEVLLERGTAADLLDLVSRACADSLVAPSCVETLAPCEEFWDAERTICELRETFVDGSNGGSCVRWPEVLKLAVDGAADLCISTLGAATWWLRRSLIDVELLSMGNFDSYAPPDIDIRQASFENLDHLRMAATPSLELTFDEATLICAAVKVKLEDMRTQSKKRLSLLSQDSQEDAWDADNKFPAGEGCAAGDSEASWELLRRAQRWESEAPRMAMDAATVKNLDVLESGAVDKKAGSLWSLLQSGLSTSMGSRRLRSWLVRPLADPTDIKERAEAVEELARRPESAMKLCRVLKRVPDLERLMQQIHSLGSTRRAPKRDVNDDDDMNQHPDARAVLFDAIKFNGKKVHQLVDAIRGLQSSEGIMDPPEDADTCDDPVAPAADSSVFNDMSDQPTSGMESGGLWRSRLLKRCCTPLDEQAEESVGCFPSLSQHLAQFEERFDLDTAKVKGELEPRRGSDSSYDAAIDNRNAAEQALKWWLSKERTDRRCSGLEFVMAVKDKHCVRVPEEAFGRGRPFESLPSGWTQRSKTKKSRVFEVHAVKPLIQALEDAESLLHVAKINQLRCLFTAFDQKRHRWAAAVACLSTLDALLALAQTSRLPGFCRPKFLDETSLLSDGKVMQREPCLKVKNGAHPCLDISATNLTGAVDVIGNDLELGTSPMKGPILILSGPNMGGKSTLLRHVCCSAVLAQVGCFVKADAMELTPVDRIFTRLGASDKINEGQSTFMVELLETASILNHATPRSLCILDELGRGTATFDGVAIAHTVLHDLTRHIRCRTLFSTHYHDLVREWTNHPCVQTGFLDFIREDKHNVVFLYKLVPGISPRSFGIQVASLANLPESIIERAVEKSEEFEDRIMHHITK